MKPFAITLTGVDDATDLSALEPIGRKFAFRLAEWGVLYSETRAGHDPRYPSFSTIEAIVAMAGEGKTRFALHICGRAVVDFIAGVGRVSAIAPVFPRVQLNFAFDPANFASQAIAAAIRRHPGIVITQHNAVNAPLTEALPFLANHEVLFDASLGQGQSPTEWPRPLPNPLCGYAGGLKPETLARDLDAIATAAGDVPFWIDMESGVRSNDRFDLKKCVTALNIAS
jgi:phosphoribosylanthranilate isomerase